MRAILDSKYNEFMIYGNLSVYLDLFLSTNSLII
jgi:hypothetical protein